MTRFSFKKDLTPYLNIGEMFFLFLLLIFLIATFQRNSQWSTSYSLWLDTNQKSPAKWRSYLYMGHHYSNVKNFPFARDYYLNAARLMDDNISRHEILFNIGNTYLQEGEFRKAKGFFLQSVDEDPKRAKSRLNLGAAYLRLGLTDKSIEEFKIATDLDPNLFEAFYNLGMVYKFVENPKDGLKYLYKARQIDRSHINTYLAIPLIYIEGGRFNDALRDLAYGKELFPDNDDIRILYQKARQELNKQTISQKTGNNDAKMP